MAIPVNERDVAQVLRPWLGVLFLSSCTLSQEVAGIVGAYAPYRQTLPELRDQVNSQLLVSINRLTGGSMCIVLDDYRPRHLTLQDLQWMTDDVMGLVFDSLTPFSANFDKLNDYALHEASLQALRVLYQKYARFFSEEQFQFLVHMVKSIYPPERYQSWLPE